MSQLSWAFIKLNKQNRDLALKYYEHKLAIEKQTTRIL